MISLEDCVALSGLTEEQVLAIAEHEHLPMHAETVSLQWPILRTYACKRSTSLALVGIQQA
jgi:hypothetical protein